MHIGGAVSAVKALTPKKEPYPKGIRNIFYPMYGIMKFTGFKESKHFLF